jgi:hypothetical protein
MHERRDKDDRTFSVLAHVRTEERHGTHQPLDQTRIIRLKANVVSVAVDSEIMGTWLVHNLHFLRTDRVHTLTSDSGTVLMKD